MGLWGRQQNNTLAEFEALCLEMETPLYSYALSLLRNPAEAEDIAQEALLRLFQALQGGRPMKSRRAYTFSIAHNLCMDRHRGNRAAAALQEGNIIPLRPQTSPMPSHGAERSLLRAELDKALAELPQDQRAALLLREFGELNYQEIADTLGSNLAQVKVWLFRARKRLAVLLDRDGQYIGKSHHGN